MGLPILVLSCNLQLPGWTDWSWRLQLWGCLQESTSTLPQMGWNIPLERFEKDRKPPFANWTNWSNWTDDSWHSIVLHPSEVTSSSRTPGLDGPNQRTMARGMPGMKLMPRLWLHEPAEQESSSNEAKDPTSSIALASWYVRLGAMIQVAISKMGESYGDLAIWANSPWQCRETQHQITAKCANWTPQKSGVQNQAEKTSAFQTGTGIAVKRIGLKQVRSANFETKSNWQFATIWILAWSNLPHNQADACMAPSSFSCLANVHKQHRLLQASREISKRSKRMPAGKGSYGQIL